MFLSKNNSKISEISRSVSLTIVNDSRLFSENLCSTISRKKDVRHTIYIIKERLNAHYENFLLSTIYIMYLSMNMLVKVFTPR